MIVGGCDVGSATAKAVLMEDGKLISHAIIPSGTRPDQAARRAMDEAVGGAGLAALDEVGAVVGTGYGRLKIPFARENVSEITCHARGAHWMSPAVRTVIDMGGQDCKAISLDEEGLHYSIARRIHALVKRVGLVEDVCLTGGCAKNAGLAGVLEEKWGMSVKTLPQDPQIAGAVGAALIAMERSSAGC
jgi:activator of 2-hydroxyglutaryl-CoA dehydratase